MSRRTLGSLFRLGLAVMFAISYGTYLAVPKDASFQFTDVPPDTVETRLDAWMADTFARHVDPEGTFTMKYPTAWTITTGSNWNADGTVYTNYGLFAPENAAAAELEGYLSEGVVVQVEMARKGYTFNESSTAMYGESLLGEIADKDAEYWFITQSDAVISGYPVKMYQYEALGTNMPEEEIATLIVHASPTMRITVKLVAPLSEEEALNPIFHIMSSSLEFGQQLALN